MAAKRKALGRGFGALVDKKNARRAEEPAAKGGLFACPVDRIVPNRHQPRQQFDEEALAVLAASIERDGVLQPLAVRPHPDKADHYELIAGERRLRASQKAGLKDVPCMLIETDEEGLGILALVENLMREDLNVLDEADAYQQHIDSFDMTQEQIAKRVGKSRVHVTNTLRLLKLPEVVRSYLASGELSPGHGRAILGLDDDDDRIAAARLVIEKGLSVRETEELAKRGLPHRPAKAAKKTKPSDGHPYGYLAEDIGIRLLGAKVKLSGSGRKGVIQIHYGSKEQLMDITDVLLGKSGK